LREREKERERERWGCGSRVGERDEREMRLWTLRLRKLLLRERDLVVGHEVEKVILGRERFGCGS
jgi:hypothetical protein